jgi:membrane-bound ClpP family serine protease
LFVVECSGGSAKVAREIADQIRELKNDKKEPFKTVAFIPAKAPDLATFIALACSDIVMYKGSDNENEAVLGDFENFLKNAAKGNDSSNNVEFIRRNLEEIADGRGFEKTLVEAMLDRNISLYRVKNKTNGAVQLVTGVEWEADQKGKKEFINSEQIKAPGTLLSFPANRARQFRIAQNTVDNRDVKEVYSLYGLSDKDVRDAKPTWIDDFARFLQRSLVWLILLMIAFAGLILEFKMPGATIPGLVSLVCFVLFFWSQAYAHGATVYLAIALFVLGVILLGLEIFVIPGFGVTGISGILLVLVAVGLATLEKAPSTTEEWSEFALRVMKLGLTLLASGAVAAVFARYLPKIPYANRLMLIPPTDKPDFDGSTPALPGAEQAAALLGQVGTATSVLRPAGNAKFGDAYVDVVTEGEYIEAGTPIQVIEVEGTRIVVKKV